ncbi:MAG: EamA family transporter [Proteobacteria bacterium]|nr:EamA family transporter [Pseudomonadota bacterium]
MDKSFLYALLTALIWGFAPALEKMGLSGKIDPYAAVVIRNIPVAVIGLAGLFFVGRIGSITEIETKTLLFLVAGGLVAGLAGQYTFYAALKGGHPSVVVPVTATYPLVAMVISILFLGDSFTWQKLAGVLLVVGGVILLK